MSSSENTQPGSADATVGGVRQPTREYEAPTIRELGSLTELTQGGTVGFDDGHGYAGASGVI